MGRALADGWLPSNDEALIVLQARDVFSTDPPLVGQPSTSEQYTEGLTVRHPGAIEFYLLAVPVRVLGPAVGTLVTAGALAGSSVLLVAWIAFRRAGPGAGLGASILLSGVMWSTGLAVLSDPISSNVGGYPLLAGTALAWALWCDDRRLWPLAVAVWSFTIQQHLSLFGMAGIVAAWGAAGAVALTIRHRREMGVLVSSLRWGAASVAVGAVCWLGPLIDQLAGTGNLGTIVELSSHSDRPTLGLARGLRVGGRAVAAPPLLVSRRIADDQLIGWDLSLPYSGATTVGVVVGVGLLVAAAVVAVVGRRGPQGRARLALATTAVVVLLGGVLTAANVPASLEAARVNFYRWMWAAALAGWGLVAWTAASAGHAVVRSRSVARPGWLAPVAVTCALALVGVVGLAAATHDGFGEERRDETIFAFEAEAIDALVARLPRDRPVRLIIRGAAAGLAVGPAVTVGLEDAGFEVRLSEGLEPGYGDRRTRPPEEGETEVLVLSGQGGVDDPEGERLAGIELPLEPGGETEVWGDDVLEVWLPPDAGA